MPEELLTEGLRLFLSFAGGGLFVYWLERRRSAPRTRVRVLEVQDRSVEVEVENTSPEPNSLHHHGAVGVWTFGRGTQVIAVGVDNNKDRRLPPLEPRRVRFHALRDEGSRAHYIYPCELMVVRVGLRRGRAVRAHVVFDSNGVGEAVSRLAWYGHLGKLHWRAVRGGERLQEPTLRWYCAFCDSFVPAPVGAEEAVGDLNLSCPNCGRSSRVRPDRLTSSERARLRP